MKRIAVMALMLSVVLWGGSLNTQQLMSLPFEPVKTIPDFKLEKNGETLTVQLPSMPVKPGKIRVLRGRFVSYTKKVAGCNRAMKICFNGTAVARYTKAGDERVLGKQPSFIFNCPPYPNREFSYFAGSQVQLPFAPSVKVLDEGTVGNNGSTLLLDVDDIVFGVDGNVLTFTNVRKQIGTTPITLIAQEVAIGYLDKSALSAANDKAREYKKLKYTLENKALKVEVGEGGGFAILNRGKAYIVETKLAMSAKAPFELVAENKAVVSPKVTVSLESKSSAVVQASWKNGALLRRHLFLGQDGLVHWTDEWTNRSRAILGMPFHHQILPCGFKPQTVLCGNSDSLSVIPAEMNPTVVMLNNQAKDGSGIGITEENDMARFTGSFKARADGAEIYAAHFALAPQCSMTLNYTVDVFMEGGYWGFINRLRHRWNIGTVTAPAPMFLGASYTRAQGKDTAEKIRNGFAHLGPVIVALQPWRRGSYRLVRGGQYPKLPGKFAPVEGQTPDLDIEEYLTFKHLERFDKQLKAEIKLFRENAPEAKLICLTHPSMECVYLPMAERWPYAENAIRDAEGKIYHHPHYDRSHLWDYVKKGWAIAYYAPYAGSPYFDLLVKDTKKLFDMGLDGIYYDEFSFTGHRDYDRYDYGRWDGFSADLDEKGQVVRLKADVAYASEGLQNVICTMALQRGLYFLGNGSPATRSMNNANALRFVEGGNGMPTVGYGHLTHVPMVYGNYGDTKSYKGVFTAVREGLQYGCLYSPLGNTFLYLKGRDNCVSKLYPMTVLELHAGRVVGKERLVTVESGTFAWPGVADGTQVCLYVYDAEGVLQPKTNAAVKQGGITLKVPRGGLVIAEIKRQ